MIDLHLHLDGSLSKDDYLYLAKMQNIDLGEDFPYNIYIHEDCMSLEDYLSKFVLPLKLLQTKEAIEYATYSILRRLYNLGYIYVEIRYAPLLHLDKGLTMDEVVQASLKGLNLALSEFKDFDAKLLLCCMRHASEELNISTVELANKYKNQGIGGVDMAGAEALHKGPYYKKVFDLAKKYRLNITIHAGESTDNEEIMAELDNGAVRIGHGVKLCLEEKYINRVLKENICFEFCPTSNLQTRCLSSYSENPLKKFLDLNIPVTINSDNMTFSNTTAISEMAIMKKTFNLTKFEIKKLLETAIEHSFTSIDKKTSLKKLLINKFDLYFEKL